MRTITFSALTLLGATACIYDNNCPDRQRTGQGELLDTGDAEGLDSPEYYLTPDVAMAGETVIVSLQSDQAVDYEAIQEISFLEDISVCTTTAREDELLVTVAVHEAVIPGAVDLIIELEDGSHIFVEAGFTVLDPNADERPEDDDRGDGSSGDSGDGDPSSEDGDGDGESEPGAGSDGSSEGESQGSGC